MKVIGSFPKGSGGDSDSLIPQHLKDLTSPSASDGSASLLSAVVGLVTLILEGIIPSSIRPLLFGAKLTALTIRCGGVRPITVGCTLRMLASKCACLHALDTLPQILAPHQLGFGITAGAEAAVHSSRFSILLSAFSGLQFVHVDHAKLLGFPLGNEAMRGCLEEQLFQLKLIGNDSTICICMMPSQSSASHSPSLNSSTSFVLPQPFPHPF